MRKEGEMVSFEEGMGDTLTKLKSVAEPSWKKKSFGFWGKTSAGGKC